MANPLKVKTFSVSTEKDLSTLEEFLSGVKDIVAIVQIDGKVLVVYKE